LNPELNKNNNSGDTIGVDVVGNGNIIGKNITIFKNEVLDECGLTYLYPTYFKENEDISEDLQKWKEGFPFSLESIYLKQEFRREKVISKIITKLDNKNVF
jgi:hypothetical protein